MDQANLKVLSEIEKEVKQQSILENIKPRLRSFFRGKSATVEPGIDALFRLMTPNKSTNSGKKRRSLILDSTSQADVKIFHQMLRKTIYNIKLKKSIVATGI